MYSLVADIFITTGLISDPIELLRVVGLLHGDPVGRWISTRCFQWLALIFCVWHIPMWQATLDDKKNARFICIFFPFFLSLSHNVHHCYFSIFFSLTKKKSKTEKNKQKTWCRETRQTSLSARFPSPLNYETPSAGYSEFSGSLCIEFWDTNFFFLLPRRSYIHSE